MPHKITGILFDLDDTLFDRDKAFLSWTESFVRTNLTIQDDNLHYSEAIKSIVSLDAHGYAPRATLFSNIKELHPSLSHSVDTLVEVFYEQFPTHMSLDDETRQLLQALEHADIPFGIVTNGSHRQIDKIQALGLNTLTSCIFISEVFGCKKPEARIFLAAASCLQAKPEEVLFVGDNPQADIWGAHCVGMRTAWLNRQLSWPSNLPDSCTDIILGSLSELYSILGVVKK